MTPLHKTYAATLILALLCGMTYHGYLYTFRTDARPVVGVVYG